MLLTDSFLDYLLHERNYSKGTVEYYRADILELQRFGEEMLGELTPSDVDAELVRENYKEMEKAANHLLSLINDVLQMRKLEDGREELSSELVCLPDVFYDMKAIIDG